MSGGGRPARPVTGSGGWPHATRAARAAPGRDVSVVWHELECGGYAADLPLWEELASEAGGPILDLGCGTGRVLLHLARRGHEVLGLDCNSRLLDSLHNAEVGDARAFELARSFRLALGPMQLLQLFGDSTEREGCLRCVAAHLSPGGVAAFAIVESIPEPSDTTSPLPDACETGGWVYSSLPLATHIDAGGFVVRRLRQTVSPAGELHEDVDEVRLRALAASTVEREAQRAGLCPRGRRSIPATDAHVGSTVVLLGKES